ncbi:hypothetical protein [Streptomyces coeruleorubidus]|uniref:Uncharacterized protein n=1 Tax=Streptomyces coeruleorubidus TaxID=116188 RepID=A0A5J6I464_STRC4|nr:hypothetical protein [Streptomyces coeruleorubidus]QEV23877.1 hypothetical protein CP976_06785 [Streptomyces coeruleorubidus]GGT86443.1 hypothetical protein GCM10010256_53360 [Streptomyces coeruleorubidus]
MSQRVWIRTGSSLTPYTTVDPKPIPAADLDEHGHLWSYDGGVSDLDAPYTCVLCCEPQWRAYGDPCKEAGTLDAWNAQRSAWIEKNRLDKAPPANAGWSDSWALPVPA